MQHKTSPKPNNHCQKRTWVLSTLSDDEQFGDGDAIPQGLAFHLSRCSECRTLANGLLAVTKSLSAASHRDPTDALAHAAQAQAVAALDSGARLTGRVEVSDDWIDLSGPNRSSGLASYTRFAAAAAIIVTVGLSGYLARSTDAESDKVAPVSVTHSNYPEPDVDHIADDEQSRPTVVVATEELDQQEADPQLARRTAPRTGEYRIRHHRSHIEAALSDDPHGAQAAWIIPDTSKRDVGWLHMFDRPATVLSTEHPDKKR